MKKKILFFISTFIFSITLLIGNVNAYDCKYYKEGNTGSTPDVVIRNITGHNTYDLFIPDSPLIINQKVNGSDYTFDNFERVKNGHYYTFSQANVDQFWYQDVDDEIKNPSMTLFFSLYPGEQAFRLYNLKDDDADKCPKVLEYEKFTYGIHNVYMLIHTDDLDVDPSKGINLGGEYDIEFFNVIKEKVSKIWQHVTSRDRQSGYLISEKYKGQSADDLIGEYSCLTYSSYMEALKETVNKSGCENNQEFNRLYQDLKDLCDYFRETKSYSKDNSSTAKNCSKACSNFKDDVGDMCKISSVSGCGSLGPKVIKWIYKVIKWARYIVPIIIIILVILEYIKALASEDEKAMKDATNHMFMRFMIAALIFILPFILDFVLNIFNITELDVNNLFCQK